MKTTIVLYEPEQLGVLDALVREWGTSEDSSTCLSLDAGIDYELERRGTAFISARAFQNRTEPSSYLRADTLTKELCEDPALAAMRYHDVSIIEPLRFTIQLYFIDLLYYVDLFARFVDAHLEIRRLIVPSPTTVVPSTSAALAEHEAFIVCEAARLVAQSRGVEFHMTQGKSVSVRLGGKTHLALFFIKRFLFGAALKVLNTYVALDPRRQIRLVVSDYWRNVAPVLRELPEAEVVMLDRTEAVKAGWSAIRRHGMRFMHIEQFISRRQKCEALREAQAFREAWRVAKPWQSVDFSFCGVSLAPISHTIMARLMERAVPQLTHMIAGIESMYDTLGPDAVLVRASVSRQPHFMLLPLVAEKRGIPALEIQHGGEYLGPGSATRRHAAHFIAAYGPLVCGEFKSLGYEQERLISAGSPRFDAYVREVPGKRDFLSHRTLTILSNTPTASTGERYGTFSLEEHFKALGAAMQDFSDVRLEITSRLMPNAAMVAEAYRRGLGDLVYATVGTTSLPELFKRADVFVCSYSTVAYEALLYRVPVILVAFAPVEKMMADFHFSSFEKAGALAIARTPEDLRRLLQQLTGDGKLRARMSSAGWDFMQKHFAFDGNASKRIAGVIRKFASGN